MLPTAFPRFPELALELRSKVWEYAIALHIEQIEEHLPPWLGNYRGGALLEAHPGNSLGVPLPNWTLHARILDPYNGRKIRFEEDEFEAFVDWLSISAVCREARICVAQFFQPLVSHVQCEYETLPLWSLKPPKDGSRPLVIRNLHCQPDADSVKYFFSRPTTLTISTGRFKSAEHFVDMVYRFFGNRIQHLVLNQVVNKVHPFKRAYWAESSIPGEDNSIDVNFTKYLEGDLTLMHVTRDRMLHAPESFWRGDFLPRHLAPHVLKIHEIFDFSSERLPELEHIQVRLEVRGWETEFTTIVMIYEKDTGILSVVSCDPLFWPSPSPRASDASSSAGRDLPS